MLQHLRPGEVTLLRHMAHQQQYGVGLLGVLDEIGSTLTHLGDTARGRGYVAAVHNLNGIHHQQLRLVFLGCLADLFHIGLSQQLEIVPG